MLYVTDAKYLREYIIWVQFNNGNSGEVDLKNKLVGPIFEPLKRHSEFAKLSVDTELNTIVWPNGADLAPEFLLQHLKST